MDGIGVTNQQLEYRRKKFEALLDKCKKRGEHDSSEYYFSRVNYKLFARPVKKKNTRYKKQKKRAIIKVEESELDIYHEPGIEETPETILKDVDANQIIDEDEVHTFEDGFNYSVSLKQTSNFDMDVVDSGLDVSYKDDNSEENFSGVHSSKDDVQIMDKRSKQNATKTDNCITQNECAKVNSTGTRDLNVWKKHIETDLNSNLKIMILKRNMSQLLETDDYDYWHSCTKQEVSRLSKYVPKKYLKEYMRHCYKGDTPKCVNIHVIKDLIQHKIKSNLHKLFIKRELAKHDESKYIKYHKSVQLEWERLSTMVPIDYLLSYGYSVIFSVDKLKDKNWSDSSGS